MSSGVRGLDNARLWRRVAVKAVRSSCARSSASATGIGPSRPNNVCWYFAIGAQQSILRCSQSLAFRCHKIANQTAAIAYSSERQAGTLRRFPMDAQGALEGREDLVTTEEASRFPIVCQATYPEGDQTGSVSAEQVGEAKRGSRGYEIFRDDGGRKRANAKGGRVRHPQAESPRGEVRSIEKERASAGAARVVVLPRPLSL